MVANIGVLNQADGNKGHADYINHKNMFYLENDTGGDMDTGDVGYIDTDGKVSLNGTASAIRRVVVVPYNITGSDSSASQTYSTGNSGFFQFQGLAKDVAFDGATTAGNYAALSSTNKKLTDTGVASDNNAPPPGACGVIEETIASAGPADVTLWGRCHTGANLSTGKTAYPTVNDDADAGYSVGDEWLMSAAWGYVTFRCMDNTADNAVWRCTQARLYSTNTRVSVDNTVTETDVLSFSIPANLLYANSENWAVHIHVDFAYLNDSGVNRTLQVKLIYGSTDVVDITTADLSDHTPPFAGTIDAVLRGNGATNAQLADMTFLLSHHAFSKAQGIAGYGTAAEDSTGALNVKISIIHSVAHAEVEFHLDSATIDLVEDLN